MKKKKYAFTLAEALILLLIAALLAAALVPVITRKHKDVGEHGEWVCTMDSDGKHVVKSTYRGKITQFETAYNDGEMCVFSPPAAAKDFTIKAVGGGGSGAGGTAGAAETIFNSLAEESNFAGVVDSNTNFSIIVAGAGGGGGGMACGEAKDQSDTINTDFNSTSLFCDEIVNIQSGATGAYGDSGRCKNTTNYSYGKYEDDWVFHVSDSWGDPPRYFTLGEVPVPPNNADGTCERTSNAGDITCKGQEGKGIHGPDYIPTTSEYQYHPYGFVDVPISGFNYNLLKLNDKEYSSDTTYNAKNNKDAKVTIYDVDGKQIKDVPVFDVKYYYLADTSEEYQGAGSTPPYNPAEGTFNSYQDKIMCFAESNIPMSKQMKGGSYKGLYLINLDNPDGDPGIKCWNLPGQGGKAGGPQNASTLEDIRAGQSIFVSAGNPGSGQLTGGTHTVGAFLLNSSGELTLQTKQSYDGGPGTAGTETVVTIGDQQIIAAGGTGGAARQLKSMQNQYVNIPVYEASVAKTSHSRANNPWCNDIGYVTDPSVCYKHPDCNAPCTTPKCCTWNGPCNATDPETGLCTSYEQISGCDESHCGCAEWICSSANHTVMYYNTLSTKQTVMIRPTYFNTINVNTCIYSAALGDPTKLPMMAHKGDSEFVLNSKQVSLSDVNFAPDADFPNFPSEVEEYKADNSGDGNDILYYTLENADRKKYMSQFGGGGYGAGELTKNYVEDDNGTSYAKFVGDPGEKGYVAIMKSNAYGGTGGQAGQYVSTMVKKLGKLEITVGKPGAPTNSKEEGIAGGDTIVKEYGKEEPLFYLKGGYGGQTQKLTIMAGPDSVKGGDGSPSPIENESNRAKIIPYGGLSGSNTSLDGMTAIISDIWGGSSISGASFGLPAGISYALNKVGGHPLDMTYGAGGGGGAGSPSDAGGGGAGTPGAVIIKW